MSNIGGGSIDLTAVYVVVINVVINVVGIKHDRSAVFGKLGSYRKCYFSFGRENLSACRSVSAKAPARKGPGRIACFSCNLGTDLNCRGILKGAGILIRSLKEEAEALRGIVAYVGSFKCNSQIRGNVFYGKSTCVGIVFTVADLTDLKGGLVAYLKDHCVTVLYVHGIFTLYRSTRSDYHNTIGVTVIRLRRSAGAQSSHTQKKDDKKNNYFLHGIKNNYLAVR